MEYHEYRTKHALAIDRALNAKTKYKNFNSKYKNQPNRSDVENYDTASTTRPQEPTATGTTIKPTTGTTTKPETPKNEPKTTGEYIPTTEEKTELLKTFHKLPPIQQHKDLLTTKNVIHSKKDISKWENNPKMYDIRGIDTQPPELIKERIKIALKHAHNPTVQIKKFRHKSAGRYHNATVGGNRAGLIEINLSRVRNMNRTYAHEIGHAYDRNVIGGFTQSGNVNFSIIKNAKKPILSNSKFDIYKQMRSNTQKVIDVTQKKTNPYDYKSAQLYAKSYMRYRNSKQELFANWFTGLINQKNIVKKDTRNFYNVFKKSNKPLFSDLRKSDKSVTAKYMKGSF